MTPEEIRALESKLEIQDHELTEKFGVLDYDYIQRKAISYKIVEGEKIVLFQGKVLNNHSYRAMILADTKIETVDLTGDLKDAINFKASRLNSKQYSTIQKIIIIMKLEPEYAKAVNDRKSQKNSLKRQGKDYPDELKDSRETLQILCDLIGSNPESVRQVKKIRANNLHLYNLLQKGNISISEAWNLYNDSKNQKALNEVIAKYPEIYKSIPNEILTKIDLFANETKGMSYKIVLEKYLFHLDFHRNNSDEEREKIRSHSSHREVKKLSWHPNVELPIDIFLVLIKMEGIVASKDNEETYGSISNNDPSFYLGSDWYVTENEKSEVTQEIGEPQSESTDEDEIEAPEVRDEDIPDGCFEPSVATIQTFQNEKKISKGKYIMKSFAGIDIELDEDSSNVVRIQEMQNDYEALLTKSRDAAEKLTIIKQSNDLKPEIFDELNDFIVHIDCVCKDLKNKLFYYYGG